MTDSSLQVTLNLPCSWAPLDTTELALEALLQQSLLVLRVVNQMESHPGRESETESHIDRIEAKLDLALNLLALTVQRQRPPASRIITLHAHGFTLTEGQATRMGDRLLLTVYLSPALPLPLCLPASVSQCAPDHLRAEWTDLPTALGETWEQWLFRRHRRLVHELREGKAPGSSA